MIHSAPLVQPENFDSAPVVAEPVEPQARPLPVLLPTAYYSTPPGDRPPLFPAWVATGCGSISIVLVVVLFAAGYVGAHGGLATLMAWFFTQSRSELSGMYAKDVTKEQKAAFEREMNAMQANLKDKRLGADKLQPFLTDMRSAMSDGRVTPQEIDRMTGDLRTANALAKTPAKVPVTVPR